MSLKDNYYKKCATCQHYGLLGPNINAVGYKCHEKGVNYSMDDSCNSGIFGGGYSFNPQVSDRHIRQALEEIEKEKNRGCYITTTLCELLGYDDDCLYLTILRAFRKNVLQKSLMFSRILFDYDTVGPKISFSLKNADDNIEMAKFIETNYLKVICELIMAKHFDEAIFMYTEMTQSLINKYCLSYTNLNGYVEYSSLSAAGHGYVRIKKEY